MTKQRKLILDIIKSSNGHMTAEEIYIKAKQTQPSIAIGTVYRNLGLMTQAEEIRRISIPNAPDRFDKFTGPHEHLICQNCGVLSDINVSDLKDYLQVQTGIEIISYELNLRYICNGCKGMEGSKE